MLRFMKTLEAHARATVSATVEDCLQLLGDVEGYPRWYPQGVRSVRVLECGERGEARRLIAELHLGHGPMPRDFTLTLAVERPSPDTIRLVREAHGADDAERFTVTWRVRPSAIELSLRGALSVPRLLPLGTVADLLARSFVDAAARALTRPPASARQTPPNPVRRTATDSRR
jgi:ribosome-associated toxin RatA of RatAB toxin-antitoxin module